MKNKLIALSALAVLMTACSDNDGVDVNVNAAPGTAGDFKANHKDRVFFNFNEAKLSKDAKAILDDQATWLKTYSGTKATVQGKCDIRGTAEYNRALGEKRAHSVKKALEKHGVAADRLNTVSFGKDRPEVPGDTEAAHAQNRVAITVVE